MASYNRIVMIGNLTKDPDYKQQASGQSVCKLSLASNRQFKNKSTGMLSQEVCYIDVDVWGPQADTCRQYLQKGKSILVEGRLKLDSWKDSDGQTKRKHSIVAEKIVFLGSSSQTDSTSDDIQTVSQPKTKSSNNLDDIEALFKDEPPFEDELPF